MTGLVVVFLACTSPVFAQAFLGNQYLQSNSGVPSYYYVNPQGGMTIGVNLWGFVGKPGKYVIPSSTDLVQLITYGGGPLQNAQLDRVKIVRRIMESDSTYRYEIIDVDLKHFLKAGENTPLLLPGDTVVVPGSTLSALQAIAPLITPLFYAVSAIATLLIALKSLR